jgi:hypothetical protein
MAAAVNGHLGLRTGIAARGGATVVPERRRLKAAVFACRSEKIFPRL